MLKRYFEIFLVIFVLFFILCFIFYSFFLDNFCANYSKNMDVEYTQLIKNMGNCKDTFVCELSVIEKDQKNNVVNWSCSKKIVNIYELDYYKEKVKILINK